MMNWEACDVLVKGRRVKAEVKAFTRGGTLSPLLVVVRYKGRVYPPIAQRVYDIKQTVSSLFAVTYTESLRAEFEKRRKMPERFFTAARKFDIYTRPWRLKAVRNKHRSSRREKIEYLRRHPELKALSHVELFYHLVEQGFYSKKTSRNDGSHFVFYIRKEVWPES